MNWMWLFLSFTGRINRAKFWTAIAIQLAIAFAFGVLAYVLASYPGDHVSWVLLVILLFPIMISVLAVMTKRLHDRDKSGWWTLLSTSCQMPLTVFPTALLELYPWSSCWLR